MNLTLSAPETMKAAYEILGSMTFKQLRFIEKTADFNNEKEDWLRQKNY